MKKQLKIYIILLFLSLLCTRSEAQTHSILERSVTVRLSNTPLKEALNTVAQQGRFQFSYNASIFNLDKKTTLFAQKQTVREVLFQLIGDNYMYSQKGEYLIIKKTKNAPQLLTGYISDAKTGKRVSNATVYDTKTLRATTTDTNGFYALKVSKPSTIAVAQLNYRDTILHITEGSPRFLKLDLDIKTIPQTPQKSIDWRNVKGKISNVFISPFQELHALNVHDSIHRRFQMSLVPYIGTNHALSGNVINDWSLNMIAGYSRGNRVAEVAGVGNFTRENISGVQIGGVFNHVGKNVQGVQIGGVYNLVNGNVKGVQIGGVFNHVSDTLNGIQIGGVYNITHFANAQNQTGGVFNWITQGVVRSQIAGVMNVADTVKGIQIAGVFNKAKIVIGAQIGLFNYADSVKGIQIGLINRSKKGGYYTLELNANEINNINFSLKTGTKSFYVALLSGITPKKDNVWTHGFGIGTFKKLNNWSDFNVELMHRHINIGSYSTSLQEWVQLNGLLDIHVGKRFEIVGGPTLNALFMNKTNEDYAINRPQIIPSNASSTSLGNTRTIDKWLGWSAGVRVKL